LALSKALVSLKKLDLQGNSIGPAGARALTVSDSLRGCEVLT
jgi:hypothetical protein